MSWSPPDHWTETETQLKKYQSVTLNASGLGTIIFEPDNARQRWVVSSVVVTTNQSGVATTIPVATLAINTVSFATMSQGNQRGASWSGNQDTFAGILELGAADFLTVMFTPPPGSTGAQIATLSGVIASAIVTGTKYTRRS